MTATADLLTRDLAHLIHPLHEEPLHRNARVWVKGDGAILTDADGREYIDGLAGLWNVTAGHGRTELADAMHQQAAELAYVSGYAGSSNPRAIELAERLSALCYPSINRFFFTSGGGEATDAASRWRAPAGSCAANRTRRRSSPRERLPRGHPGGNERHRAEPLLAAVRAAGSGLLAHPGARSVPLRGASRREPGGGRRQRARTSHPAGGPRHGGDVHRRAGAGRRRRHRPARTTTSRASARSATATTCCSSPTR